MDTNPLVIPTLSTIRLRLEPLSMAHSDGMFMMWRQAAVQRFSGPAVDENRNKIDMPAATHKDSDGLIRFWLKAAADGWGFRWAVLRRGEDDTFVGHVGFNSLAACSEIAYHMDPSHWGQGFMTEAAQAAIQWRRQNDTADKITDLEAFIEPANHGSIALAERLGLTATPEFSEGCQRYHMPL